MALLRAKKAELIDTYTNVIKDAHSAVYVKFKGLSVAETSKLRKELFAENMTYSVVKKTLWKRATDVVGIKGDAPIVAEEMAVIAGTDLLAPARVVYEFSKTHKDTFGIVGGIFDGEFKSQQEMLSIATIPPREVLLSQLAFLLKSPMQKLAIGLNEVALKKTA
jgi:large subunit ribosomal protein L10